MKTASMLSDLLRMFAVFLLLSLPSLLSAEDVYCKYCGNRASSISSLTANKCPRHPSGAYKGRHAPMGSGRCVSERSKYQCEYCGASASSISSLTSNKCPRHPDGAYKGRHLPYSGGESKHYQCEYCGASASSISSLTSNKCPRHPDGAYKGRHHPY